MKATLQVTELERRETPAATHHFGGHGLWARDLHTADHGSAAQVTIMPPSAPGVGHATAGPSHAHVAAK